MLVRMADQSWGVTPQVGASQVVHQGGYSYLVGGPLPDGTLGIYCSSDGGVTWVIVGNLPSYPGSKDPALAVSPGYLHVLQSTKSVDLTYNLTYTMVAISDFSSAPPIHLIDGSQDINTFDIAINSAGAIVAVASAYSPMHGEDLSGRQVFMAFTKAVGDQGFTAHVLENTSWHSGDIVGTATLLTPASGDLELYYTYRGKQFLFKDIPVQLCRRTITGQGAWGTPDVITTYMARLQDHRVTAIATPNGGRAVSTAFYTWDHHFGPRTNIVLGVYDVDWVTQTLTPPGGCTYKDPIVGMDGDVVTLAYLKCPKRDTSNDYSPIGLIALFSVSPSGALSMRAMSWPPSPFRNLIGSKTPLSFSEQWELVGIRASYDSNSTEGRIPYFLSDLSQPPVALIYPATLTLRRGTTVVISAGDSYSQDFEPLTFAWDHTSPHTGQVHLQPIVGSPNARLTVDREVGPEAQVFSVLSLVTDATHATPVTATCEVRVELAPLALVTLPRQIQASRSTDLLIRAIVDYAGDYPLVTSWTQVSGSPVTLADAGTATVVVGIYRTNPLGETVVVRLTVTDGINPPVAHDVELTIPGIPQEYQDTSTVSERQFQVGSVPENATIANRNSPGSWEHVLVSDVVSDFLKVKISFASGQERVSYIGEKSMVVMSRSSAGDFVCRRLPASGSWLADACHDENDRSYLLTTDNQIGVYKTLGTGRVSDCPDTTIPLPLALGGSVYTGLSVTLANAFGDRVLCAWGTAGVVLFQVNDNSDGAKNVYLLGSSSGILADVRSILFTRLEGVHTLTEGQLLIGFTRQDGSTYEALIDLQRRAIQHVWDKNTLIGSDIHTGEILGTLPEVVALSAPVISSAVMITKNLYEVAWYQGRADTVMGYEVWISESATPATLFGSITGGQVRRVLIPTKVGKMHMVTVRARGRGEMSEFSPAVVINA